MKEIYICENNEMHLRGLMQMLQCVDGEYRVVGFSGKIKEAVAFLSKNHVDVLLLNAELGDGTAFELLNLLDHQRFKIVFTHTNGDHALSAIRFAAVDYLVKPYNQKDLEKTLGRVRDLEETGRTGNRRSNGEVSRITIHGRQSIEFIEVDSILFCKADINYTELYLSGQRKIVSSKTLKEYDLMLRPHFFFRTHQSYLVNMKHVRNISRDKQPLVTLETGETIPLTRNKRPLLIRQYGRLF